VIPPGTSEALLEDTLLGGGGGGFAFVALLEALFAESLSRAESYDLMLALFTWVAFSFRVETNKVRMFVVGELGYM